MNEVCEHICNQVYKSKLSNTDLTCDNFSDVSNCILEKFSQALPKQIHAINQMGCMFSSKALALESLIDYCKNENTDFVINFPMCSNWKSIQTKTIGFNKFLHPKLNKNCRDLSSYYYEVYEYISSLEKTNTTVCLVLLEVGSAFFQTPENLFQMVELVVAKLNAHILLDYSNVNFVDAEWLSIHLLPNLMKYKENIHSIVNLKRVFSLCDDLSCVILTCGTSSLLNIARRWSTLAPVSVTSQQKLLSLLNEPEWLKNSYLPFIRESVLSNLRLISTRLQQLNVNIIIDIGSCCGWCNVIEHLTLHNISDEEFFHKLSGVQSIFSGVQYQMLDPGWARISALINEDTLIRDLDTLEKVLQEKVSSNSIVTSNQCERLHEEVSFSGDTDDNEVIEEVKCESLDDLFCKLIMDVRNDSSWLQEHTAERWMSDNPVTAELYLAEREKCLKSMNEQPE